MTRTRFVSRFLFGAFGAVVLFLLVTDISHAALLYLDPGESTLHRGDTKTISLRIDPDEGECINTVDAVITYDPSIRAVDISRGDSILSLWVEDPVIDEEKHQITLAGGIPGGYCGRIAGDPSLTNVIADLVFRSPGFSVGGGGVDATAKITIDGSSQVLLHDGFGTKAPLRTIGATVTLLTTPGSTVEDDWLQRVGNDTTPPGSFSITLARDEQAFSGKYFITFNTQDKQSGIDHYEVMEEPIEEFSLFKWGAADAPWKRSESPYVLEDQSLNSTIRVRAIDKAGLETIAVLVPDDALRRFTIERAVTLLVVVSTVVLVVGLIGFALFRRKEHLIAYFENRRRNRGTSETHDDDTT